MIINGIGSRRFIVNLFSEFLSSKQEDLLSAIENQSNFNNNTNE